jgi:DNA-binding beta-propeller fold protein YncE
MRRFVSLCGIFLAAPLLAQTPHLLPHSPDLYVSGFFASNVRRIGGPLSAGAGTMSLFAQPVARPWGLAFGPDGALYVANPMGSPAIVKINGPFSDSPGTAETFVSDGAFYDLAFGADGNLYAAGAGSVLRYDIVTRQLIDTFTHGYTLAGIRGIAFGPDGDLYVSNFDSCVNGPSGCTGSRGEIVRFDGSTGAYAGIDIPNGRGGLREPWKIAFNASGDLLVANFGVGESAILRFPPRSGSLRTNATFIKRDGMEPLYLAIGPDRNIYVSNSDASGSAGSVLRFDGRTGAFIDVFVPSVDGGPRGLAFALGK